MNEPSWKTTVIGIVTLIAAICAVVKTFLTTGNVDGAAVTALIVAVGHLFSTIFSKDATAR